MTDERGSAVPFALACLGVVAVVGVALALVGAMVVGHRRAEAAADLAALAGAVALADGADGCDAARRVAGDNGGSLATCDVDGRDLRVTVAVKGPDWLGSATELRAEARAGPA